MNRLLRPAILCAAACSASLHAAEWITWSLPEAAKGKALRAVWFLDDGQHGWIVGDGGLCFATEDGGKTWEARPTGSGARLRDVRFNDATHGWACGEGDPKAPKATGHVVMGPGMTMTASTCLVTEDGGKSWSNHWVPTNFELHTIEPRFAPAVQTGNSGGERHLDGDKLRSANGGKKWQSERVYRSVFDIRALDEKRWVLVGSPVAVGFMPKPTSPLYVNGACRALFSTDGGASWQVSKGTEKMKGRACLRGLAAKTGGLCIAAGDGGTIARSEDQGETWSLVDSGAKANLRAIAIGNGEKPLAVAAGAAGTVLVSADGGKTWKAHESGGKQDFLDVTACGEGFAFVSAEGVACYASAAALAGAK